MSHRGLLLTITEPPPAMEEEFNAWYDTEHLAERLAIPGFRSTRRWTLDGASGAGKYLTTYELDSAAVLESPAYLARYHNQTPWSRRCLAKTVVFKRWACEQVQPGAADPHPLARALLFVAADGPVRELAVPGALQTRRFVAATGQPRHIALIELAQATGNLPAQQPGWLLQRYRAYAD
jgi:hypothetical protein